MLAPVSDGPTRAPSSFGKLAAYMEFGPNATVDRDTGEIIARGDMLYSDAILTPAEAAQEMQDTAERNGRIGDPILHYQLAWQPGEKPTREQWDVAVRTSVEALGVEEHQWIAAAHNDTDAFHVHVMVNRVHPDTYLAADMWRSHERLDRACREIEHAQGWAESNGLYRMEHGVPVLLTAAEKQELRERRNSQQETAHGTAAKVEIFRDAESFQTWIKGDPAKALDAVLKRDGATWQDVHAELAKHGLTMNKGEKGKLSGYTVSVIGKDGEELRAKASDAFRKHFAGKAQRAATDAKLGEWEPARLMPAMVAPPIAAGQPMTNPREAAARISAYQEAIAETPTAATLGQVMTLGQVPTLGQGDPNKAKRYRQDRPVRDPREREQQREERTRSRAMLRAEYGDYIRQAKADEQRKRTAEKRTLSADMAAIADRKRERTAVLRAGKHPPEIRRVVASVIAAEAIQARAVLIAAQAEARQQRKPQDYRTWCEDRAAEGRADAIAQVRGFRYADQRRQREETNGVAPEAPGRFDPAGPRPFVADQPPALRLTWAVDTKRGQVMYAIDGKAAFTDAGKRIHIPTGQADAIDVALRLASQKYGSRLQLTGDAAWREQAVRVAVDRGMHVTFAGADEKLRQQLVAERDAARQTKPQESTQATRQAPTPARTTDTAAPAPGVAPAGDQVAPPVDPDVVYTETKQRLLKEGKSFSEAKAGADLAWKAAGGQEKPTAKPETPTVIRPAEKQTAPVATEQKPDALAPYRKAVVEAEASGDTEKLETARLRLEVATEYQQAGRDLRAGYKIIEEAERLLIAKRAKEYEASKATTAKPASGERLVPAVTPAATVDRAQPAAPSAGQSSNIKPLSAFERPFMAALDALPAAKGFGSGSMPGPVELAAVRRELLAAAQRHPADSQLRHLNDAGRNLVKELRILAPDARVAAVERITPAQVGRVRDALGKARGLSR